ncbi:hypothetical protein SAMN04487941_0921 [Pontibacter akesuensis]|uniref:Uncharacterized protein n=1 Tax=Pontibacter akesuensis TaxID=388950 RepID=A0A1I7GCV5_9BACT|nr:hypothetical protein GCM10007389_06500 [Pontibacter akesuensis]SFU46312.1 hypothetical protein SAMN04487941_0921 [Pontibacter akesuensis]
MLLARVKIQYTWQKEQNEPTKFTLSLWITNCTGNQAFRKENLGVGAEINGPTANAGRKQIIIKFIGL